MWPAVPRRLAQDSVLGADLESAQLLRDGRCGAGLGHVSPIGELEPEHLGDFVEVMVRPVVMMCAGTHGVPLNVERRVADVVEHFSQRDAIERGLLDGKDGNGNHVGTLAVAAARCLIVLPNHREFVLRKRPLF